MSDDYVEKIAGELADLALADERRSGDERIVNDIAEIVGSSSQTLQESFLTAVRVRRAERRARQLLADRASGQMSSATPLLPPRQEEDAPAATDADLAKTSAATTDDSSQPETETPADTAEDAGSDNKVLPARPQRR